VSLVLGGLLVPSEATWSQPPDGPTMSGEDLVLARAIDRKFDEIVLSEKAVPEALSELGDKAGVRIRIDDEAVELLPWGAQTRLSAVRITNASLREALPQILGALGMTYEERGGELFVTAMAPLARMNRRANWDDLKLLRKLNETQYAPENFAPFKLQYRITAKVDPAGLLAQQLAKAGGGTIAQILEVATGSLGWTWFPNNDHVVIMTQEAQIAHRLARRVTSRYSNVSLSSILLDLAKRAGVGLYMEPGMMLKLPPGTSQSYTLALQQSSIRQALEVICAETGLKYEVRREGIYMSATEEAATGAAPAAGGSGTRPPYVGKITIPGKDGSFAYEFLVRENELPADILEYRKQIINDVIDKMRAELSPDNTIKNAEPAQP
jgi:hypothetical protein